MKEQGNKPVDTVADTDMLLLDNQLCFALYVCSKEIIRKYKTLLEPLHLTYTGYIVMMALWETNHVTVNTLGKRLYLDSGTLTPLLKKLETQQYIRRMRSPQDERNVYIELTEQGKALKTKAAEVPQALICSTQLDMTKAIPLREALHELMLRLTDEG